MNVKDTKIWDHYQKLQESLSELIDPAFNSASRSLTYITLNQCYTHAERLFELVEQSPTLSRPKQPLLAKLAHHIEVSKDKGLQTEFIQFIKKDMSQSLNFIRSQHALEQDLAS